MSETTKIPASYGKIEVPSSLTPTDLLYAFAKAYYNHATTNALVSDEVLVSSIGASNCRKEIKLFVEYVFSKKQCTEKVQKEFIKTINSNGMWTYAVLSNRYTSEQIFKMICQNRFG